MENISKKFIWKVDLYSLNYIHQIFKYKFGIFLISKVVYIFFLGGKKKIYIDGVDGVYTI